MWSWFFGNSSQKKGQLLEVRIEGKPVDETNNESSILEWKDEENHASVSVTKISKRKKNREKSGKRIKARQAQRHDESDDEEGVVHVYCFHGRGQTMDQCEHALSSFSQNVKESARRKWFFHYRQGFYRSRSGGFAWYPSTDTAPTDDFFQNRLHLMKCMERNVRGNRDTVVLLGFGEGAAFALDLAYRFKDEYRPGWLCGVVAIAPPLLPHVPLSKNITPENPEESCNIPTCLITSRRDRTVAMEKSLRWRKLFSNTKTWQHDLGHYLPLHLPEIQIPVLSFLEIQNEHREVRDSEEEEDIDC
jgi:predicted esterase